MTEEEKPLTREDVLKMIEEHGGSEGLDLSGRNLEGIDLSSSEDEVPLDLHGINLNRANLQRAKLWRANLQGAELCANMKEASLKLANLESADLRGANLQGAGLSQANLQRANIAVANLQGASIDEANMENANLAGANLQYAMLRLANLRGSRLFQANLQGTVLLQANLEGAMLDGVRWAPKYIVGDEEEAKKEAYKREEKRHLLSYAESVYRNLKKVHNASGMYDIAGEFYFREMTVKRKALKWWPNPLPRTWSKLLAVLCGYGEKPFRVVAWAAVVVFGMAGIYSASALTFLDGLYYSAVSFTALGYGLWVSPPEGWVKALGAAEAFIGVFMIALFLITFVRKMTR